MDAQWLQDTVGEPLALGLSKLSYLTIDDPIEYLGNFLIQYANNQDAAAKRAGLQEQVAELEQKEELAREVDNRTASAEAIDAAQTLQRLAELESLLQKSSENFPASPDDTLVGDKLQQEYSERLQYFADTLKGMIDASAVYIGKHLGESGIEYLAATRAAKHVVGKVQEFKVDEEGNAMSYPFAVFEPVLPVEDEGEDGEAAVDGDEEGSEKGGDADVSGEGGEDASAGVELPLPAFINVPSLVQDAKVHSFGVPKHGAYLAIHAPYVSSLHVGALPDMGSGAAAAASSVIASEGSAEESPDATTEGTDGETPAAATTPAPPGSRYLANKQSKSLVVCCDTMGTGRPFSTDEVATARALVVAFTAGLSALSDAQFQVEMGTISRIHANKEGDESQLTNQLAEAQEEAKTRFEAFIVENEEAPQEEKAMQEAMLVFEEHKKIVSAEWVTNGLALLKQLWLPPTTETVLAPLLASLHMLGVLPTTTLSIDWTGEFKTLKVEEILSKVNEFSVASVLPEVTEELGAALDACGSAETVRAESVIVGALFTVAHAALDATKANQVHEVYLAELKAAEEAARAEEEEAAKAAADEAAEAEDDE